jgi:hypothetical protein
MKRLLTVLITCLLVVAFSWATPQQPQPQARLMLVKSRHRRGVRHHAHRATRHRAPKHAHRAV